jgi:hypothetical protein
MNFIHNNMQTIQSNRMMGNEFKLHSEAVI